MFSLEWKRASRVPKEDLGSRFKSLLRLYDHGLAPRVSTHLGICSPVCSDTSSHRKMVGASEGYEQVVASCCLRIRKRLEAPPPGCHLGHFWREKPSSTKNTPTGLSTAKMYQRSPSKLTMINHLALFPIRASRRWEYSHNTRILGPIAN